MAIKRVLILIAFLACAVPSFAQTTSVSATAITDAGSVVWKNGTFNFQFVPSPVNPFGPYVQNGAPFNTSQVIAGSLDSAGSFTQAVPDNKTISPAGSGWKFTVCPAATAPCSTFTFTITGASQVISVTPPAIVLSMSSPPNGAAAYTDGEVIGARQGQFYFNLTDNTLHMCSLPVCTWLSLASPTSILPLNNTFSGNNSFNGNSVFAGQFSAANPCSIDGLIWVSGAGCFQTVQAAITAMPATGGICNANAACVAILPPGTYVGPTLSTIPNYSAFICMGIADPLNATGATCKWTYSSTPNLSNLAFVRFDHILWELGNNGIGMQISTGQHLEFSYGGIDGAGDTSVPALLIQTNGTTSAFNSVRNIFDHFKINCITTAAHFCNPAVKLAGSGAVNSGAIATGNVVNDLVLTGNIFGGMDFELNSDTNFVNGLSEFNSISPGAGSYLVAFNLATPGSDQDANVEQILSANYTGPSNPTSLVRYGQSTGNVFDIVNSTGSQIPSVVVVGGSPQLSGRIAPLGGTGFSAPYNCMGGNCADAPIPVFAVSIPGRATAIGNTGIYTPTSTTSMLVTASISCDVASAAASVQLFVGWTDPSNTVQSFSGTNPVCTTLGAASYSSYLIKMNVKANTQVTFNTAIANAPTYTISLNAALY